MQAKEPTTIFAALGDPTRQRIIELLAEDHELRLSDLADEFDSARQTITRHLDILCAAGVTKTDWRGRERITRLSENAFDPIRNWLEHYDRFWGGKLEQLKKLVEQGQQA